jgi:hypothetical protein
LGCFEDDFFLPLQKLEEPKAKLNCKWTMFQIRTWNSNSSGAVKLEGKSRETALAIPKVATRKKIQTLNPKSNREHKKPSGKSQLSRSKKSQLKK